MTANHHYDVIIIGTGAGGGTLAYKLAGSGKRILVLERGGYVPREKENWDSSAVFIHGRYNNAGDWTDKDGRVFHPGQHYFVGGNTKFYGAVLFRLRERDFGEVRHHGGISPAWPIGYRDMEPFYTAAEYLYHVHGERGVDPTDPPASKPYPHPAVRHEPRIQQLFDDFQRQGYHPFPLPVGVRLNEADAEKSECIKCATCDGYPCLVNAKSDAHITCVRPALENPNVSLLTHAYVPKLETSASGREVTAVHVERRIQNGSGEVETVKETYSADVVVSSCGAINSAALLLRSANDKHPNGLANGSDMVGRHYMCHNNSAMLAISKTPNPTKFQKTLGVNDFYCESPDWEHPMGHLQMLGKSDRYILETDAPSFAPGMSLEVMANHSIDFWMTSEDLPDPNNRVLARADGGVSLHYSENNTEGHRRLVAKLKDMLNHAGCETHLIPRSLYFGKKIPIGGVAHQCGTVRFGDDPKTSALDVNCKAHELDNLYVVDGSFFVSSAAVNPALTIMANALRVGEHLLERMR